MHVYAEPFVRPTGLANWPTRRLTCQEVLLVKLAAFAAACDPDNAAFAAFGNIDEKCCAVQHEKPRSSLKRTVAWPVLIFPVYHEQRPAFGG